MKYRINRAPKCKIAEASLWIARTQKILQTRFSVDCVTVYYSPAFSQEIAHAWDNFYEATQWVAQQHRDRKAKMYQLKNDTWKRVTVVKQTEAVF